jgi:hypothetical protein
MAQAADGVLENGAIVGMDHGLHRKNFGVVAECLHRPINHRLAAERTILFWAARAGPQPTPGCDNKGGGPLRFGHATQAKVSFGRFWMI